ncbi:MAG: nucleotidyltransferase domain-containing protein [Caulobacteraceae bacterium]
MRLTEEERRIIRDTVAEVYGPTAVVRLFGSRVRDDLRGGDIDLHIEADPAEGMRSARSSAVWDLLQERLGEQKIDIVETVRGRDQAPIEKIAYRDGVAI